MARLPRIFGVTVLTMATDVDVPGANASVYGVGDMVRLHQSVDVDLLLDVSEIPTVPFDLSTEASVISSYGSESTRSVFEIVPEPATLFLLAVGGLALLRRRR